MVEVSWNEFSEGKVVRVERFPGQPPAATVLARACSIIVTRYDLLRWNCEHLVRFAHGLPERSPQAALGSLALLGTLWLVRA